MSWLKERPIPASSQAQLDERIGRLAEALDDAGQPRNETVRSFLAEVLHGQPFDQLQRTSPMAAFSLDSNNVTFEAEHYVATDQKRFQQVKPLLWAWKVIDGTPFGQAMPSGILFRRMLAERVFGSVGRNIKIFPGVEFSVGYNLSVGDDVVIHRHVFIDDIGGVEIHDGASLSDYANVYSHTHALEDTNDVTLKRTVIGRGVRVAYHATLLAGTVLSDDSLLGAMAVTTKSVDPHVVAVGIPARPRAWKKRAEADGALAVDARRDAPPKPRAGNPAFASTTDET